MEVTLTKDADALVCILYKKYCQDLKDGTPKAQAKLLGGSKEIFETLVPQWSFEDVDETCRELDRSGLVGCRYNDNIVSQVWFTDTGIIYMENRFKNGLNDVLDYLGKIKGLIPFI
ncbi:hypothetical protein P9D51_23100 [Bacillus sonorensis]|uniref:hypothetical protein n=1 Tax=Bacillus sonorensis TaxID=119858 RepID=UPI0022800EA4|nr:hypothetical protein [Bacillus sonorensis]MCY8562173.1 hypothetical protein [Bacillus sonorensis]MEC1428933.1 hypothetical protein [Bacillus sonorensis]